TWATSSTTIGKRRWALSPVASTPASEIGLTSRSTAASTSVRTSRCSWTGLTKDPAVFLEVMDSRSRPRRSSAVSVKVAALSGLKSRLKEQPIPSQRRPHRQMPRCSRGWPIPPMIPVGG
ncbi:hypothetical protein CSHISOI_10075, partial [Colletotrichum shisoi]